MPDPKIPRSRREAFARAFCITHFVDPDRRTLSHGEEANWVEMLPDCSGLLEEFDRQVKLMDGMFVIRLGVPAPTIDRGDPVLYLSAAGEWIEGERGLEIAQRFTAIEDALAFGRLHAPKEWFVVSRLSDGHGVALNDIARAA